MVVGGFFFLFFLQIKTVSPHPCRWIFNFLFQNHSGGEKPFGAESLITSAAQGIRRKPCSLQGRVCACLRGRWAGSGGRKRGITE